MLKISKAVGAPQAKKYYRSELKKDAEMSLAGGAPCQGLDKRSSFKYEGEWCGRLADEIG